MSRLLIAVLVIAAALVAPPAFAGRPKTIAGIPLPPASRTSRDGIHIATKSFSKTVVYFKRYLNKQGMLFQEIPTYQVRGTQVSRLLSKSPRSPWLAIHVYRIQGLTQIFVVPRPIANKSPE